MARPKRSKNRPKSDSNGLGHNSGDDSPIIAGDEAAVSAEELTDEEKQVIYFDGKREIVALNGQVAILNLKKRDIYENLKLKVGLLRAEVDYGIAQDDEDEQEKHARRMMVRRWEHPGEQAEMFGDGIDRTPAVDKAYALGKKHGLAGDPCSPGCDPSTPQHQAYMTGFHEGNAVLALGIKRLEPPVDNFAAKSAALAVEGQKLANEMFGTQPATAAPSE